MSDPQDATAVAGNEPAGLQEDGTSEPFGQTWENSSNSNDGPAEEKMRQRELEVYRGRLLQLSHFLNTFQNFYSCDPEEEKELETVITPQDIEDALVYRFLLQMEEEVLDQKCSIEADQSVIELIEDDYDESMKNGEVDPEKSKRFEEDLLEVQEKLSQYTQRSREVLSLLQRFEVWSTKDMADSLLMPDCGCKSRDDATRQCWSKLLHIPGAVYFADRWPSSVSTDDASVGDSDKENNTQQQQQQQHKKNPHMQTFQTEFAKVYQQAHVDPKRHHNCSMVIPPTIHTFEEYARIAQMIALLPNAKARLAADESPCNGAQKSIHQICQPNVRFPEKTANLIYKADYRFEAHDLVALWVRSQRSTFAFRHLIQLYSRMPKEDIEGELVKQDDKGKSGVLFQGNHKTTKRRVMTESRLVDDLVTWCVMNQIFITYHFMVGELEVMESEKLSRKRARDSNGSGGSPSRKRVRMVDEAGDDELQVADDSDEELLRACYCFILQWFSRRNLCLVAILFDPQQSLLSLPSPFFDETEALSFLEECNRADIPKAIKQYLKEKDTEAGSNSSSDCFFSRIHRKVRRGKYSDISVADDKQNSFYLAVSRLLTAWRDCIMEEESIDVCPDLLTAVLDDFDLIYEAFCRVKHENGLVSAARSLLEENIPAESNSLSGDLNSALTAPWNDGSCAHCDTKRKDHPQSSTFSVCSNCERAFCCPESELSLRDPCKIKQLLTVGDNFPGLDMLQLKLFPVELPPHTNSIPDFRGENSDEIEWTSHIFTVRRRVLDNGKCESWGLTLRPTEKSREFLDNLKCGNVLFEELFGKASLYPLALESHLDGCLVTDVAGGDSPGRNASIQQNDVLVSVQFISFAEGTDKPPESKMPKNVGSLSGTEILSFFKIPCTELKVTVKRPSINLIECMRDWCGQVRVHNSAKQKLLEHPLAFCKHCQSTQNVPDNRAEADRIRREAKHCKAIIRRLGMESYAKGFHNEELLVPDCSPLWTPLASEQLPWRTDREELHLMCVSFSRLDAMMDYIILSTDEQQSTGSVKKQILEMAFFLQGERLSWAPAELEKKPGELLSQGIYHLIRSKSHFDSRTSLLSISEERNLFYQHFIYLFCSWYLAPMRGHTTGPPSVAFKYRRPWMDQNCDACHVRAGTKVGSQYAACDSAACRRKLASFLPQLRGDPRVPRARHVTMASYYEEYASLVGTSIFLFPGDPALEKTSRDVGWTRGNFDRPVEFLVACFVPAPCKEEFLLLPVMEDVQLKYLLDRCDLMDKELSESLSQDPIQDWIEASILGLKGVLHMSCKELTSRLRETSQFLDQIKNDIATKASGSGRKESMNDKDERCSLSDLAEASYLDSLPTLMMKPSEKMTSFLRRKAARGFHMIDFLERESPVLPRMIEASDISRDTTNNTEPEPANVLEDHHDVATEPESTSSTNPESILELGVDDFDFPRHAGLEVLYSDLYFTSPAEKSELRQLIPKQHLQIPVNPSQQNVNSPDCEETIVLSRSQVQTPPGVEREPRYKGIGFGFELCFWIEERCIRVGRVHPNSPAAASGLKTNDMIVSINGRSTTKGSNWSIPLFVSAILGGPLYCNHIPKRGPRPQLAAAVSGVGSRGPSEGPVVLKVCRQQYRKKRAAVAQNIQQPQHGQFHHQISTTVDYEPSRSGASEGGENHQGQLLRQVQPLVTAAVDNNSSFNGASSARGTGQLQHSKHVREQTSPGVHNPLGNGVALSANSSASVEATRQVVGTIGETNTLPQEQELRQGSTANNLQEDSVQDCNRGEKELQDDDSDEIEFVGTKPPPNASALPDAQVAAVGGEQVGPCLPNLSLAVRNLANAVQIPSSAQDKFIQALCVLKDSMQSALGAREFVTSGDLYRGIEAEAVVLSKLEVALLLKAIEKEMPMLGMRLLSPRYSLTVLIKQVVILAVAQNRGELRSVPRLSDGIWTMLAHRDYQRFTKEPENNRKIFTDESHSYGYPNAILPIDRYIEQFLRKITEEIERGQQPGVQLRNAQVPNPVVHNNSNTMAQNQYNPQQNIPQPRNHQPYYQQALVPGQAHNNSNRGAQNAYEIQQNILQQQNFQPPTNIQDPSYRIRGGGYNVDAHEAGDFSVAGTEAGAAAEVGGGTCLSTLPVESWRGQLVTVSIDVGETQDDVFIGYVQPFPAEQQLDEYEEMEIPVALIYSNTMGAFAAAKIEYFPPSDLKLEPENSWYRMLAADIKQLHQFRHLVRELKTAIKPLGYLPDGREVLWIPDDPTAMYIHGSVSEYSVVHSAAEKNFRKSVQSSHLRSHSSHCCVWGCTFQASGNGVEFDSEALLVAHNKRYHAWESTPVDMFCFAESGRFFRISTEDGEALENIIDGLTSATCARVPSLVDLITTKADPIVHRDPSCGDIICSPLPHSLILNYTKALDIINKYEEWDSNNDLMSLSSKCKEEHQPLYLALRIKLVLFYVKTENPSGRFSSKEIKRLYTSETNRSEVQVDRILKWNAPCCCSSASKRSTEDGVGCSLCTLLDSEENVHVEPQARAPPRGFGCSLASSILLPELKAAPRQIALPGSLGFCKEILLGLAKKMPAALRMDESEKTSEDTLRPLRKIMWGSKGSKAFQKHVLRSQTVAMLSQAFVVLLGSIRREKLPLWWQAEHSGWSKPQRLLIFPTKSSLLLSFFLFDAALCEFMETAPESNTPLQTMIVTEKDLMPPQFISMKADERIQELLDCARKVTVERFHGTHNYFCCVCDDGGQLLCCEFCETVCHHECASPPLVVVPRHWVCAPCTVDILNLVKK